MKDRTREALMSLLGGTFPGRVVFDLFGGSGILGFEAVSRQANQALIFEILRGAVPEIAENAQKLGIGEVVDVVQADIFDWSERLEERLEDFIADQETPWIVFCCPPYSLWETQPEDLKNLVAKWSSSAPPGSLFAVELEEDVSEEWLPSELEWDVRLYRPTKMAIAEKH